MKFCIANASRWVAFLIFAIGSAATIAQTKTWTGGGAPDASWSNAANWGGTALNPLDALSFGAASLTTANNNTPAGTQYNGITFEAAAPSYSLTGNGVTLGGDIVDNSPNSQNIALPIALSDNRTLTVGDGGSLTLDGVISSPAGNFGITKTGLGTLRLGAGNTYTGVTVLDGGTLVYATDNTGVAGISFGITSTADTASTPFTTLDLTGANVTTTSLDVQSNNMAPEVNTIAIGAGKTLTVNGGFTVGISPTYTNNFAGVRTALNVTGDRLTVNAGGSIFRVGVARANSAAGGDPTAFLDLSSLSNFSHTGTNHFRVGNGNARGEMNLANTSNTITAAQIRIGDSGQDAGGTGGSENNNAGRSFLRLGAAVNVLNTDLLIIGRTKSGGTIEFQQATGTLMLAGSAGGTSTANIVIGSSDNATGGNFESMLLLNGHSATVQGGDVVLGQLAGGGAGSQSARGSVAFDTGTFNAQRLRLAVNTGGAATIGASGTFTLGGPDAGSAATGVLNVTGDFFLAQRTNTTETAGPSTGTFVVNGGTANIDADIIDASTTVSTAGPNLTTLTLAGGTLNMMGHNIGSTSRGLTTISLLGGTLNNPGLIAGKSITLAAGLNLVGSPSYLIDNSELTGSLDASGLGTLNLPSGGFLQGGGSVAGNVVVAGGARVAVGTDTGADTLIFSNNLTLNNGSNVRLKLSENAAGNDQATVFGNLTAAGTVNLEIDALGMGPQSGNTYTLFNYSGALTGNQTNFAAAGPLAQSRLTFTVVPTATTPGAINVQVGGAGAMDLKWIGNVDNRWNLVGAANWRDPAMNGQQFFTLDRVTFDDTSTNTNDVELIGPLRPGSVTVNATRNYTFAGAGGIIGGGGLTKQGTGTLTLATANSYTGQTTISSGTLQVGNGGATGSLGSGLVANDGVLVFNRNNAHIVPNVIAGTGELRHTGTSTLTLSAANTYTGPTNIVSGTVAVTDETSLGDLTGGPVTISVGAALDLAGGTAVNGTDFGVKQFRIVGTGVGGTGVLTNSGTVAQQNAFEQVILTGNATVGGTGRFDIRGDTSVLDLANFTLTKAGPNQFTLVGTTVSDGNIVVNQGTFAVETTTSLPDNGLGHTITYNAGTNAQFFNLTGNVTRPMILNGGVTMGNASGAAQPSTVGSNITLNGDLTVTNLNNSAGALVLGGVISETGGPRALSKTGPTMLTLNGANTYTGSTTIADGTLRVTGSINNTAAVTVAAPGMFVVEGTASSVGGVSGAGTTTVGDDVFGTTLTASHVRQARLTINISSQVTTRAGGGTSVLGELTIAGPADAPTAKFDINNNAAIIDYSGASPAATVRQQILASRGGAGLGATWTGMGIASSTAAAAVATEPESRSIGYAENAALPLGAYTEFRGQMADETSVLIAYTRTADANLDGIVDDNDVTIVGANYAPGVAQASWAAGDFDYNGFIDDDDVTLLGAFYDPSAAPLIAPAPSVLSAAGIAAVPEPSSLVLLGVAAAGLFTWVASRRSPRRA
jgi:autotransporter-associated beta strand protein